MCIGDKLMKLAILFLFLYSSFGSADDFLNEKIANFKMAKSSQEKEAVSSELFFIADNKLKTGDSGMALLYFKTALIMTPENNYLISPKIEKSLGIFLEYTFQIPKENCSEIRERYTFIREVSPDSMIKIINQFPECLSVATIKERLTKRENTVIEEEKSLERREEKNKKRSQDIFDFETNKSNFFNVEIPKSNYVSEQKIFNNMGEELDYIDRMKTYLPIDLIRALHMSALRFVLFSSGKISAVPINDEAALIIIPYKFDFNLPEPFRSEICEKYKNLLHYDGPGRYGKDCLHGTHLSVSHVVANYLVKKNFINTTDFPVLPSVIVFKAKLQFADNVEILLLPSSVGIYNKDFKALVFTTPTNDDRRYMPDIKMPDLRYFKGPKPANLGIRLSRSTVKELKSISIDIDIDATYELDKLLSQYMELKVPIEFKDIGYVYEFYGENGGSLSGITVKNKKEGLFYVSEKNKDLRTIYYEGDSQIVSAKAYDTTLDLPDTKPVTNTPGFSCAKATTFSEKEICRSTFLSQLDLKLSDLYKKGVKSSKGKTIKQTQRTFIAEREKCTNENCIRDLYQKRIAELEN